MNKKNVLVFPCGSEIGLEIYRSVRYSTHFNLYGGSSIDDHGKFVYENYIDGIPFIDDISFIDSINSVVYKYHIDIIYPTMDLVIAKLSANSTKINCKIASSTFNTTEICLSKRKTYQYFRELILVPQVYESIDNINKYPVFLKPDIGYSGKGTYIAENNEQVANHLKLLPDCLILEYLPGDEYTVDCFTDKHHKLRFCGPRIRSRISNGISVNTKQIIEGIEKFNDLANIINDNLEFRGAWFYQVKRNNQGQLTLMEIATRLGGSSSLFRAKGVNFALLNLFVSCDIDVDIILNDYSIELDRSLDNKYKLDVKFSTVYVDFDDCLIIDNKVNEILIKFIFNCLNNNKKVILITKHDGDLISSLNHYRLNNIFDDIIHISKEDKKYKYLNHKSSIFIDDSFSERKEVSEKTGISVFSPDMIDCLFF